ncbi:VIT1/CCC1 transporter family protein [Candidatus Falkowbacteria bacterium]|nr:VIT1/CCC1 transporter family protein [Candidatus Falkowbacteria bacterium]
MIDDRTRQKILTAQKNEITEYFVYKKLAHSLKKENNKKILEHIAQDELNHYNFWKNYSQKEIAPDKLMIWKYFLVAKILGITFGIRLMEKGEKVAQRLYQEIAQEVPEAMKIHKDEDRHEQELISLINEKKLKYIGSIVLGLNDALVELTGALAGLTLALQNSNLIAVTGLITGIAASFSMSASEYLSTKSETKNDGKNPFTAAVYTGIAYVLVVLFLIFPYLVLSNVYLSLAITIFNAIVVILAFTFYISVAQDLPFTKRFLEMASISLSIASLTFVIGWLIRIFFHIEV